MCFHFPHTRVLILFRILHLFTITLLLRALHSTAPHCFCRTLAHTDVPLHWLGNQLPLHTPIHSTVLYHCTHCTAPCGAVYCANFESSLLIGELPLSVSRIPKQKSKVSSSPSGQSLSSRMATKLNFGKAKKKPARIYGCNEKSAVRGTTVIFTIAHLKPKE